MHFAHIYYQAVDVHVRFNVDYTLTISVAKAIYNQFKSNYSDSRDDLDLQKKLSSKTSLLIWLFGQLSIFGVLKYATRNSQMAHTNVYELVNMHNWPAVILPASLYELA